MHVAHRGLNVIVSRYVLQRKRIRVVPRLGQKGVAQRMQARVGVRLDLFAQLRRGPDTAHHLKCVLPQNSATQKSRNLVPNAVYGGSVSSAI